MKRSLILICLVILTSNIIKAQEKVYAPALLTPVDSAINQMADVFLDWSAVAGTQIYEVQIDSNNAFLNPIKIFTIFTAAYSSDLFYGIDYSWRVRAIGNPGDTSAWSVVYNFTIIESPVSINPIDSSGNNPVSPLFKWELITGSNGYDLMIDTANDFSSPYAKLLSTDDKDTLTAYLDFFGENYYYKLRAFHSQDTSEWSDIKYFTTRNTPVLQSPLDSSIEQTPVTQLQFKGIMGSTKYQYEYSLIDDFSVSTIINVPIGAQLIINPSNQITRDTVVRINADTLQYGQTYHWRARAFTNLDTSDWSPHFATTIIPEVKTLWSPAIDASDVGLTPRFRWSKINGSDGYYLEYSTDSMFLTDVNQFEIDHPTIDTVSYTVLTALPNSTKYFWRVKAFNNRFESDWKSSYFTTISTASIGDINNTNLTIYPNPTKGNLKVQFFASNTSAQYRIGISNIIGQEIISRSGQVNLGQNTINLNLENLENGIYFINIETGNKKEVQKIILDK